MSIDNYNTLRIKQGQQALANPAKITVLGYKRRRKVTAILGQGPVNVARDKRNTFVALVPNYFWDEWEHHCEWCDCIWVELHEDPVKAMIRYQDINRDRTFREKIQKIFSAQCAAIKSRILRNG